MSRKNIFEILAENNSIGSEAERIEVLFDVEKLLIIGRDISRQYYTIKDFVSRFCFDDWKNRGHCLDLQDFLDTVDYDTYSDKAKEGNIEAFLIFSEIVLNCWKMTEIYMSKNDEIRYYTNFYFLLDIINDCLSQCNYKAVYDKDTEQALVIEDNPAITAVAEIVEPELSLDVLKYNHYTLRGDIAKKKAVLLALGAELEPKRRTLSSINSTLEDSIFFILNNMNLRHNNVKPTDKKFKEFVAQMNSETLEGWYDELYQMMLLAFLELDQIERNSRVKILKEDINGVKQ